MVSNELMLLCLDKRYFHSELLSFCQQLEVSVSQSLVYRTISIFDMNFLFIHILHVGKTIYITAGTEAFRIASN